MRPPRSIPWGLTAVLMTALLITVSCATVDSSIVKLPLSTEMGVVSGLVLVGGVAFPGAVISTLPATVGATTDASGRFTLGSILPQTLTVIVQASGYQPGSKVVTVLPSQTVPVEVTLSPSTGPYILGRITDGVLPISGATVTTVPPTRAVTSATDGTFSINDLTPGIYRIDTTKDGFFGGTTTVTLAAGQNAQVTLARPRRGDGIVTGTVTDGTNPLGSPTSLVRISLFAGTRQSYVTRPLQPNEQPSPPRPMFPTPTVYEYYFDGLTVGYHVLQAEMAGYLPGIKEVRVEPPLVGNGDIVLSTSSWGGAVTGTVFDPFLQTLVGANVSLSQASQAPTTTTTTDSAGRYRFFGLPPGDFDVSVSSSLFSTATLSVTIVGGRTADGTIRIRS